MTNPVIPNVAQKLVSAAGVITRPWFEFLQGIGQASTVPSGVVWDYAGSVAPSGFLMCRGGAFSRSEYPNLNALAASAGYAAPGGPGDGLTTFNVPNYSNVVTMGAGTHPLGATGGSASVSLSSANLPAHNHAIVDPGHMHTLNSPYGVLPAGATGEGFTGTMGTNTAAPVNNTGSATTGITTSNTGSGTAFSILPPYAVTNKIIKT